MTRYVVNEFNEVVPVVSGRKSNDSSDYRYLTDFEEQLIEEIIELKEEVERLNKA